ncbi:phasin family protein [Candidatus Contubernalis alkaliaceticus]|uniref:phasin family protein n=1 Tax=Candidatus Contubernalis alkaliaceticus TaxID=338645 RepID=UPI001F4BFE7C|nr:hypothetical protein [Candidatus Contubernalis alkalaceticus]UNC92393.1 hypothetical protein HUE98_09945 [Candidatus Contubernalis alkalaceticus]
MMNDFFNKTILFGLGAISLTKEKAEEMVDMMVKKGEVNKDEAQKVVNDFVEKGKKEREVLQETIKNELNQILNQAELATKEDIGRLENKIDELKGLLESKM